MISGSPIFYNTAEKKDITSIAGDLADISSFLINNISVFTGSNNGSITELKANTDFEAATFSSEGQYTQVVGRCTQPDVYPPTISTQYYVINTANSKPQDVSYAPFTYGPSYFDGKYTF